MSDKPSFFAELKRRHVYRVGAAYAVSGWLLVQIVTQVLPVFHVGDFLQQALVVIVVAGFPIALVLAWIYDLTPRGIVRTAALPPEDEIAPGSAPLNSSQPSLITEPIAEISARLVLKAGDSPPQRPNWKLVECLGTGGHGEVWLARNLKTHEDRVYKFALTEACLSSFKREVTVSRLVHDTLGERSSAFVRVLEWNFDQPPYFLETEFVAGGSLVKWAESQGGIGQVSLTQRMDIARQIAEALAAAHSVDVLHKDLKPANVLIDPLKSGRLGVRLCDFGSSGVLDPERLAQLGITRMGFTQALQDVQTSGTPVYFPPEILAGEPATKQSDLFSLGVILYQLAIGDFRRPLAPGWELDVEDSALRNTIASAAAGNPARRMKNAEEFVERLGNLSADTSAVARASPEYSLAVLPFLNLGDVADDYLCNSFSEELLTGLSRVAGMHVLPPSAVSAHKNERRNPARVGQLLKVQMVVAGTLRKDADQLTFSVRLIRTEDEKDLWANACQRDFSTLLELQEEMAKDIVAVLQFEPPAGRLVQQGTDSLPAYDFFLRGRQSWMAQVESTNLEAIDHLQKAIDLDPNFARSHSHLAQACCTRIYFINPDDQAALKRGFAAAERALMLDPNLADAHLARGRLAWSPSARFAYGMAIKEFKRALAINGRLAAAWGQLSAVYLHLGNFDEAFSTAHRGLEADPADQACAFMVAQLPVWNGDYEEGLDRLERLPRGYNPTLWYYATLSALLALERNHEAEARLDEFFAHHKDGGGLMTSIRARTLALAGRQEEAQQAILVADSADRRFGHFHHTAYEISGAYALMNRREDAFKYLHEAVHTGYLCCSGIDRDPMLESLRSDPQYQKIMEFPRKQCEQFSTL